MIKTLSSLTSTKGLALATAILFAILSQSCNKKVDHEKYLYAGIRCDNNGYGLFSNMPLSFSVYAAYNKSGEPMPNDNDKFYWTFGDGSTSTSHHPQHTYSAAGIYTVSLTFNGYDDSRKDLAIQVSDPPAIATVASISGIKNWHGTSITTDQNTRSSDTQPITESFELKLLDNVTIVAKGDTFKYRAFNGTSHSFYNADYLLDRVGVIVSYKYIEYYPTCDSMHYKYMPYSTGDVHTAYDLVTP